jgi:ribosome-binding protein aMBF1 (putative translation factor)
MSSENEKMMNELESLLAFNDEKEKIELEATLLHLKFVKIIEEAMKQEGLSKKNVAEKLDTSKSYITQLFSGDKLLNMKTLAKIEQLLNINFDIKAEPKRPMFKTVDREIFRRRYSIDSVNGLLGEKYPIEKTPDTKLKLVA